MDVDNDDYTVLRCRVRVDEIHQIKASYFSSFTESQKSRVV